MSESTSKTILRNVQDILWANLPLDDGLPDAATIYMLRAILQLPLVRTAIDGDDIAANFVLRSMRTILADETLPPCKLLSRLWQLEAETNASSERQRRAIELQREAARGLSLPHRPERSNPRADACYSRATLRDR